MKNKKVDNNKDEREILKDLKLEGDTKSISAKVSALFDNLNVEEETITDKGIDVSEVLNYVLSGEYGLENADEISDRIIEELKNKGII